MRLFDHLDSALLAAEQSKPRVSREAVIWPSSASAELYDKVGGNIVGKCHRQELFKMIGETQTNPTDEVGARKFRLGRACEEDITQLAKNAGIFVASGVRVNIPDINMHLELDMVVIDQESKQGYIVECKSISGRYSVGEVIEKGNPKKEAVIQLLIYLNEFRNGAVLKAAIREGLEKQQQLSDRVNLLEADLAAEQESDRPNQEEILRLTEELIRTGYELRRNRIEVDPDNLEKMSDGPLLGKLAYEDRGDCGTREFDVEIHQNPVTGKHVPKIDREPYAWFDVESVYARFRQLKERYQKVRDEAVRRLKAKGIEAPPAEASWKETTLYWDAVGAEMRNLPKDFLPPAEYEFRYSADKIKAMYKAGLISKYKYDHWSKGHKGYDTIGDWQCAYCGYRGKCLPLEYPEFANANLLNLENTEEVA